MNKNKIIFWASTGLFFAFQGLMPAFTSQSEMAKEGIRHLQYPAYFGVMLAVFKVVGSLVLIIPQVPARFKEWAYGCFIIELIAAFWSNVAVDGFTPMSLMPVAFFGVLATSYISYHRLKA